MMLNIDITMTTDNKELKEVLLPTGKSHISFSELSCWVDCGYKHHLIYIRNIEPERISPYLDFGTAIHKACENFLKTRKMDTNIAKDIIMEEWPKKGFRDIEWWQEAADKILNDFPGFLEKEFPGWKYKSAEESIYESIDQHPEVSFKGYLDGVIVANDKRGNKIHWILDYKTCSWGWRLSKKMSHKVKSQVILYKNFYAKKYNLDPKNIRCAFVLMKRDGKAGSSCELFPVSAGEKSTDRSLRLVNSMLLNVKKGLILKNRKSCEWCEFDGTKFCP